MKAAVLNGYVEKLGELIGQDPGFDVNKDDDYGRTLLHHACSRDSRSAVVSLLLAHPVIDVNLKDMSGRTPFSLACYGYTSCVREMLKDSRVKVNEPDDDGETPLWHAACNGYLDIIRWWISSGREMDLGEPGYQKDGCHWSGKETGQNRSGDPAGEIQE